MHRVRLGVLDVGSNTVHLLVVDAFRGAHPTPMSSEKSVLRLAEQLDDTGQLTRAGADHLVRTIAASKAAAQRLECEDLMAFATSAVREARNSAEVLDRVWGADYVGDTKTLDVHVKRLRSKIEPDPSIPKHLVTVRGLGYKFES